MPTPPAEKLVIAISSSALFDLSESHAVFTEKGLNAYAQHQISNENKALPKGEAFQMVEKLLALNDLLQGEERVEVILLSRNSADTGLRIFNPIEHYNLNITRAAFCGGESPYRYINAFGCQLFLSTHTEDVRHALKHGIAAATILRSKTQSKHRDKLRFAFDGDAVLFSDEAEKVYQHEGLDAFAESEKAAANEPLSGGPFKHFLRALQNLQGEFSRDNCPIRTALVTARSAPAHERVIRTLRKWNIRIDESLFLGGLSKGEFLKAYRADVFFDDHPDHCESASKHVATGHVPHGITNRI